MTNCYTFTATKELAATYMYSASSVYLHDCKLCRVASFQEILKRKAGFQGGK